MHPNIPMITDNNKGITDNNKAITDNCKSKSKTSAFASLAVRCLILFLLSVTQTLLIAAAETTNEQAVINDARINTTKHPQGTSTQSTFEPVITAENGVYVVFDSNRSEHAFHLNADDRFVAFERASGTLTRATNGQLRWTDDTGQYFQFTDTTTSQTHECIAYPTTPAEEPISGTETPPQSPEEPLSDSETDSENPLTQSEEPLQCDTETSGPHIFQPNPYHGPQITLDARPASCESYFVEFYGTDRGFEIEAGLQLHSPYKDMQPTVRNFPVIDFIDDSRLVVVHSRDLGNRTFNSPSRPDALLDQLLKDAEQIQTRFIDVLHEQGSISATERGQTTTITVDQFRPVTMQLVIRDGIASADHWRQIAIAKEQMMRLYGITLEVVVIP